MVVSVTEYTDTACSWAWGSEPKMRRLHWAYGEHLTWRRVMGGLLPDDWPASGKIPPGLDIDHPDAIAFVLRYHAGVCATTGMPHPGTIHWQPQNSNDTGRAYIAARAQGEDVAARLLRRCREAQFLFGRPAGNETQVLALAAEVPGLDVDRLAADLSSAEVAAAWKADWEETRRPNEAALTVPDGRVGMGRARTEHGRTRYGFPTLIFRGPGGEVTVPGWRPWEDYEQALATAAGGSLPAARPLPSPAEALDHHGLLARPELDLLCAPDAALPADALCLDLGGGPFWLSPDEAASRQLGVTRRPEISATPRGHRVRSEDPAMCGSMKVAPPPWVEPGRQPCRPGASCGWRQLVRRHLGRFNFGVDHMPSFVYGIWTCATLHS